MGGSRADDENVLDAAQRVLDENPTVVTQRRMAELVSKRLANAVTPQRVRRLLIRAPFCRVEYRTRDETRRRGIYSCPICGAAVERAKNQTLFGGEVTLTLRCTECKYWTGRTRRVPTVYSFHLRGKSSGEVAAPTPFKEAA